MNDSLVAGGDVQSYQISPDNSRAVYLADQETDEVDELYSVPADGSDLPIKLNSPLAPGGPFTGDGGDVEDYHISPDSSRVVYRADQETDEVYELYRVPLDGTGSASKLNGPLVVGRDVQNYQISPDSSYVVYRADQENVRIFGLYKIFLDGVGSPIKLNNSHRSVKVLIICGR